MVKKHIPVISKSENLQELEFVQVKLPFSKWLSKYIEEY